MVTLIDLPSFANRVSQLPVRDPNRVAVAGRTLVDGAIRIRRGDGVFGDSAAASRPVTKPAEAIAAWIGNMQRELTAGGPFHRHAELREALAAAGEEVDAAVSAMPGTPGMPAARRLQSALYSDAIGTIDDKPASALKSALPWIISAALAGILVGILVSRK